MIRAQVRFIFHEGLNVDLGQEARRLGQGSECLSRAVTGTRISGRAVYLGTLTIYTYARRINGSVCPCSLD